MTEESTDIKSELPNDISSEFSSEVTPIRGIAFLVKHPYVVAIVILAIAIFMSVAPVVFYGFNAFASGEQGVFYARDEINARQNDAAITMRNPPLDKCKPETLQAPQSVPGVDIFKMTMIIYMPQNYPEHNDNFNMMTISKLKQIEQIENKFFTPGLSEPLSAKWRYDKQCLLESASCTPPTSIISYFKNGTEWLTLNEGLANIFADPTIWTRVGDKNFSPTNPKSTVVRSMAWWGRPLSAIDSKYCNVLYERTEQDELYIDYVNHWYDEDHFISDTDDVAVSYFDAAFIQIEVFALFEHDMQLLYGSGLAVFVVLCYGTGSLFLSIFGGLHIFISFPAATFVYRVLFQIEGYPGMNMMVLFIILGIGADDVFVLTDAWKQSYHQEKQDISTTANRMSWAWKRASHAMAITTLTTFAAFVCTAFSPIPSIAVLGIFAAAVVLTNFILVITWYPAIVIIRESTWIKPKEEKIANAISNFFKRLCNKKEEDGEVNNGRLSRQMSVILDAEKGDVPNIDSYRAVEKFYYLHVASNVNKYRRYILGFFVLLIIGTSIGASYLDKPDKMEFGFPIETRFGQGVHALMNDFPTDPSSFALVITLVLGLEEPYIDRAGTDRNDVYNLGEPVYASKFDISNPLAQQWVYDMCVSAVNKNLAVNTSANPIECFMVGFEEWASVNTTTGFPVPQENFIANLTTWLLIDPNGMKYQRVVDIYGLIDTSHLRYALIDLTYPGDDFGNWGLQEQEDLRATFKEFEREQSDLISSIVSDADYLFATCEMFMWVTSSDAMRNAAWASVGISLLVSFFALVLSTGNIIVSFYAVITICAIVTTVLTIIVIMGHSFGVMESIAVTLLVGVSVDFCVHFAHAYIESHFNHRFPKARMSLTRLGISVLNGAITTLSATFFLFFCLFDFFTTFGTILFVTIICSFIFSHTMFMAILMEWGPEGTSGDWFYYFGIYWNKYVLKKEMDIKSDTKSDDVPLDKLSK